MRTSIQIQDEIVSKFGFLPAFFEPALDTPGLLETLWQQTLLAYFENPIPALFKEQFAAMAARTCKTPYSLVCHSCTLRPLGMKAAEILELLQKWPSFTVSEKIKSLNTLSSASKNTEIWPKSGSAFETAILHLSLLIFSGEEENLECKEALKRALSKKYYNFLILLISYNKTCLEWTEAHPELSYEADKRAQENMPELLEAEPKLAEFYKNDKQTISTRPVIKSEDESKFRKVYDSNMIGIIFWNDKGEIFDANDEFLRLVGYSREELEAAQISWKEMTPAEYITLDSKALNEFATTGKCVPYEKEYICKNGSRIPLIVGGATLTEVTGIGGIGFILDNSKRKKAESALKISEKSYKILAEKIPQIVFESDPDGNMIYMNRKWREFTGFDSVGATWDDVLHADDLALTKESWVQSIKTGIDFNAEYRLRKDNGDFRWVLARAHPAKDELGNVTKWFGTLTDIHERKIAEETSLQMAAIIDASIDAILSKDLNGIVKSWNKAAEKLFGYSAKEIIGRSVLMLFPKERHHEVAGILSQIKSGKTIEHIDTVLVSKSGHKLTVNISIFPILNKQGRVVEAAKMIRDVTELRNTEFELSQLRSKQEIADVLQESEAKFKGAFENSPIGILLLNPDESWHDVNLAFCAMLGYSRSEIFKKELNDLLPESERDSSAKARKDLAEGVITVLSVEKNYIHKEGHLVPIWLRGSIIRERNGRQKYLMFQVQDMTECKKVELSLRETTQKLKYLIDYSPAAILTMDNALNVTIWNPACERIFGWTEKEALGKFPPYIPKEKEDESHRLVQKAHESREPIFVDLDRVRKDGTPIKIHAGILSISDNAGNPSGLMAVLIDVTEKAKAELKLQKARELAEAATQAKSEFLANMSHEIRTPINGVLGMSGLILDSILTEEQKEYAENIRRSADSLLCVINDILDFSKVEAGKLDLENIEFDLEMLIQDTVTTLDFVAKKKELHLQFYFDKLPTSSLIGDPGRLRQVITNLLSNAVKFTKQGDVKINIIQKTENEISALYRFEVCDSGIGISKEAIGRLFHAFSQADPSTTRKFGGTGLGLSISKKLIELMGGKIGVESVENVGSTFWFEAEFNKGSSTLRKLRTSEVINQTFNGQGFRILVAEDNVVNQIFVVKILEKLGFRIDVAANGKEVINSLQSAPYDAILMDCQMPELDGYEATQLIRQNERLEFRNIPIIAMTANALSQDKEKCLEAGMNDYISKPAKTQEIIKTLEFWLTREKKSAS